MGIVESFQGAVRTIVGGPSQEQAQAEPELTEAEQQAVLEQRQAFEAQQVARDKQVAQTVQQVESSAPKALLAVGSVFNPIQRRGGDSELSRQRQITSELQKQARLRREVQKLPPEQRYRVEEELRRRELAEQGRVQPAVAYRPLPDKTYSLPQFKPEYTYRGLQAGMGMPFAPRFTSKALNVNRDTIFRRVR